MSSLLEYRRIAKRFPLPLFIQGYIAGKLALDPAFGAVERELGDSLLPIVDVGCGLGLLAHYLRARGITTPIRGYDVDAAKIEQARRAAHRAGLDDVEFEVGDAACEAGRGANIVLLDVIHYLPLAARSQLLANLRQGVESGATVLLRTTRRDASWRYRVTLAEEWWSRVSRWIPLDAPINFPSDAEILEPFRTGPCEADVRPLWGCTPFNSHLYVIRPAAAEAALETA